MTQLEDRTPTPSITAAGEKAISSVARRIGSWEVLLRRRPRYSVDLASRCDLVSGKWGRTAHRFQLEAAYREPFLTSQIAVGLAKIGLQARILDCSVGNGSLSISINSILKGPVECYKIDTSAEMLVQAKSVMQHSRLRSHLMQADVLSMLYSDQSFYVDMAEHVLENLPDPQCALAEMVRVLGSGRMVILCVSPPSISGAYVQLLRRTWVTTEQQGVAWLHSSQHIYLGRHLVQLGSCSELTSASFGARRPL